MQGEIPSHFITCSLSALSDGQIMRPNIVFVHSRLSTAVVMIWASALNDDLQTRGNLRLDQSITVSGKGLSPLI